MNSSDLMKVIQATASGAGNGAPGFGRHSPPPYTPKAEVAAYPIDSGKTQWNAQQIPQNLPSGKASKVHWTELEMLTLIPRGKQSPRTLARTVLESEVWNNPRMAPIRFRHGGAAVKAGRKS